MANKGYPIAYLKRGMATDVDACNLVGVANTGTTLYNGTLVTIDKMNTAPAATGLGYVFNVTPTTASTAKDVWMVRSPEVNVDGFDNLSVDPRDFSIPAGRPADLVRLMPGTDFIHISEASFGSNQKPDAVTNKFVEAAANGQYKAVSASTATGIVFVLVGEETIPVGQEFVKGYILKCVQNPTV